MTADLALVLNIRNPYSNVVLCSSVGGGGGIIVVMSGAVVCQAVSVRVVGEDRLKVIFKRSVRRIKNDVSAAEAAGGFPPKRGRGFPCLKQKLTRDLKSGSQKKAKCVCPGCLLQPCGECQTCRNKHFKERYLFRQCIV